MASVTLLALVTRILVALSTRTFFQPDEYFQSLEPAHDLVFGYGHLTWEWTTPYPIRSILYPALNVPVYWILKVLGLDSGYLGGWLLVAGPKILHGTLAAATDIWLCKLTRRVLGERYVSTVLFLSLTSFFHALALSRSLSNSTETSLATIAFSYYPWDASSNLSPQLMFNRSRTRRALALAALTCAIRPTNAVIWIFLFSNLCWQLRFYRRALIAIILDAIVIGTVALSSIVILDSFYFQKLTLTPVNFLLTNLSSVSLFYGGNPWHYYITQGLPILCTTALPFVIHGVWSIVFDHNREAKAQRTMLGAIVWTIGIYSIAGHKEWRFLHPLLPLLHLFAAKSLIDLGGSRKSSSKKKPKAKAKHFSSQPPSKLDLQHYVPPIRISHVGILLLTIPASVYVVLFYCSAPISVTSYIRNLPEDELRNGSVGFLMPCHSTPGQAYMHRRQLTEGRMWALGCEPPLGNQDLASYKDQTDVFYESPYHYLQQYFPAKVNPTFPVSPFPTSIPGTPFSSSLGVSKYPWLHEWPRYLVLFGALLEEDHVRGLLEAQGYKEVWKRGREWEGEGKRRGGVRVWKWLG